ncbi:MAG: rhodanese-like domain-containing protein [Myxococcaceae bacterium]
MPVREITPEALREELNGPPDARPALLDVRTYGEHQIVALPGSELIPLGELEERQDELEALRGREVVVYCHHGVRSLSGAAFLESLGFDARSLSGGIEAWALRVDPTLPRY